MRDVSVIYIMRTRNLERFPDVAPFEFVDSCDVRLFLRLSLFIRKYRALYWSY